MILAKTLSVTFLGAAWHIFFLGGGGEGGDYYVGTKKSPMQP